nr:hypothetical protein [Oceanococcus sp. HetDA_MAG_MS8]
MRAVGLLYLAVGIGLAACGGGGRGVESSSDALAVSEALDAVELAAGCHWFEVFREGEDYFSLADSSARYWVALGPTQPEPGTRLVAEGVYPNARYFSLHLYDGNAQSRDALADVDVDPGQGFNPYRFPELIPDALTPGGSYSVAVEFGPAPLRESRRANTLYRGRLLAADARQRRSILMYREYLAQDAPVLPELVVETPSGQQPLAEVEDVAACAGIREEYRRAYLGLDQAAVGPPRVPADDPPRMRKFQGAIGQGEGAFVNRHVSYLYALPEYRAGEVLLMRLLAPRVPAEQTLLSPLLQPAQLRFWSVCQQGLLTAPVAGCVHDVDAALDANGYATIWISRADAMPNVRASALAINSLPWGAEDRGFPVYRHMLPEPRFAQSIQAVNGDDDVESTMQDYAPRLAQCHAAELDAVGASNSAELFAACEGLAQAQP